jgi:hypothetical protein
LAAARNRYRRSMRHLSLSETAVCSPNCGSLHAGGSLRRAPRFGGGRAMFVNLLTQKLWSVALLPRPAHVGNDGSQLLRSVVHRYLSKK